MNEAEYLMKNYGDRGGCYLTRLFCHYILYNVLSHIRVIIHGFFRRDSLQILYLQRLASLHLMTALINKKTSSLSDLFILRGCCISIKHSVKMKVM